MSEESALGNALDGLGRLIMVTPSLAVKALGLLLLGRDDIDEVDNRKTQDPTSLLLDTDWFDRAGQSGGAPRV